MLKESDLRIGMRVKVSDIWDIPGIFIHLGDFKQLPVVAGEGVILSFGKDAPRPDGNDVFTFYLPYEDWLEEKGVMYSG